MTRRFPGMRLTEIGVATLLLTGCLRQSARPVPPADDVSQAARAVAVDYAHRLAESFADTAEKLRSQSLTTAAETNSSLQTANTAVRKQAFQPLDQRINDEIGGDEWDARQAEQLFEQIAHGLRSVR